MIHIFSTILINIVFMKQEKGQIFEKNVDISAMLVPVALS